MKTPDFDIFLHDVTARQMLYASDVYIKWCIKIEERSTFIFICIAENRRCNVYVYISYLINYWNLHHLFSVHR